MRLYSEENNDWIWIQTQGCDRQQTVFFEFDYQTILFFDGRSHCCKGAPPREAFAAARLRPVETSDSDDDNEAYDGDKELRCSQRHRLDNGSNSVEVKSIVRTQTVDYLDLANDDCSVWAPSKMLLHILDSPQNFKLCQL